MKDQKNVDQTAHPDDADAVTVKRGLAQMLKGGVIMDVVTPEQAKIAEEAGRRGGDGAGARSGRHSRGRRRGAHERPDMIRRS